MHSVLLVFFTCLAELCISSASGGNFQAKHIYFVRSLRTQSKLSGVEARISLAVGEGNPRHPGHGLATDPCRSTNREVLV